MLPPAGKNNIRTMMERTFNLMSNSNTLFDKTYCDVLIEPQGIEKFSMFDLNNQKIIMEAGYHYAALKMSEKESWRIVEKCHKHYQLTKKISTQIDRFRGGKS